MYSIHYTAIMKNKNILILIISFIILLVACSALSMSAVASNYRYTWVAMNPWNGVEGIAFTVGYFLHTGKTVSMLITIGLLFVIWWRLYSYSPDLHHIIFIMKSIHHSCTLINSFVLCKFATSKNDRDRVI